MVRVETTNKLVLAALVVVTVAGGCAQPPMETAPPEARLADISLKFSPQQEDRYRVTTESRQSVNWQGPLPDQPVFQGGRNISTVEMLFTQRIQSVTEDGSASAQITIDGLKYSSVIKDTPVLQFDSASIVDPNSPCARLIGQSYTITITPAGKVLDIDAAAARRAVEGSSDAHKIATRLLEDHTIQARHGTAILPRPSREKLSTGQVYKNTKDFTFGLMGSKAYERIYRVERVQTRGDRVTAVIKMETVPAAPSVEELQEAQSQDLSKKFDTAEDYTGEMIFDATAGRIDRYNEQLELQWTLVEPAAEEGAEPLVLKMGASRLYTLEKID